MSWNPVTVKTEARALTTKGSVSYAMPLVVGIGDPTGTELNPIRVGNADEASKLFGSDSILTRYLTIMFANGMSSCYALDIHTMDKLKDGLDKTVDLPVRILVPVGMTETESVTALSVTVFSHIKELEHYNRRLCFFSYGYGEIVGSGTNPPPSTITEIIASPGGQYMYGFVSKIPGEEVAPGIAAIVSRKPPGEGPVGQSLTAYSKPDAPFTLTEMALAAANNVNVVTTDSAKLNRLSTCRFNTLGDPETGRHLGSLEFVFMELMYRAKRVFGDDSVLDTIPVTTTGMFRANELATKILMDASTAGIIGTVQKGDVNIPCQDALAIPKEERTDTQQEIVDKASISNELDINMRFTYKSNIYYFTVNISAGLP